MFNFKVAKVFVFSRPVAIRTESISAGKIVFQVPDWFIQTGRVRSTVVR